MRNIKKKYGSKDSLKIAGASFDLMGPDIDSPEIDKGRKPAKLPSNLKDRIKKTKEEMRKYGLVGPA